MNDWERALQIVKNVVVIVTCMVILFVIGEAYLMLQDLGDQLRQVGQ